MEGFQRKYLTEAGLRIQHEGFIVCEEKNEQLPIEWAGSPICNVNGNGGMSYDPEQIRKEGCINRTARATCTEFLSHLAGGEGQMKNPL